MHESSISIAIKKGWLDKVGGGEGWKVSVWSWDQPCHCQYHLGLGLSCFSQICKRWASLGEEWQRHENELLGENQWNCWGAGWKVNRPLSGRQNFASVDRYSPWQNSRQLGLEMALVFAVGQCGVSGGIEALIRNLCCSSALFLMRLFLISFALLNRLLQMFLLEFIGKRPGKLAVRAHTLWGRMRSYVTVTHHEGSSLIMRDRGSEDSWARPR